MDQLHSDRYVTIETIPLPMEYKAGEIVGQIWY
jgi:hypothetical protein